VHTIFWSYERGTWPYDVMVVVILLFVLLTPGKWFHDQPKLTGVSATSIQLVTQDDASRTRTYRLDAAVLPPEKRAAKSTPELEREVHNMLGRTVDDLKDRTFHVLRIDPVLSSEHAVQYYDVTIGM